MCSLRWLNLLIRPDGNHGWTVWLSIHIKTHPPCCANGPSLCRACKHTHTHAHAHTHTHTHRHTHTHTHTHTHMARCSLLQFSVPINRWAPSFPAKMLRPVSPCVFWQRSQRVELLCWCLVKVSGKLILWAPLWRSCLWFDGCTCVVC